jgi:hypothetical protein
VQDKLGDHPTVKLRQVDVARAAREADQRALQAEAGAHAPTNRASPSIFPDIEVSVDDANLEDRGGPPATEDGGGAPPTSVKVGAHADDESAVRRAPHEGDGPRLTSVPCVVASREDLSWFQLEETSQVVLAMIDGESTVESILGMLTIPHASTLAILRELGAHGVIEFHES